MNVSSGDKSSANDFYYFDSTTGDIKTGSSSDVVDNYSDIADEYIDIIQESSSDSTDFSETGYDEVNGIDQSQIPFTSVSDGDLSSGDVYVTTYPSDYVSVDDLYQLMANIPSYAVYPNTTAVDIFSKVLKSSAIHSDVKYVVVAGNNSDAYLYYSDVAVVNGKSVTFKSPVTQVHYYSTRNSGYNTEYHYSVSQTGDQSVTLSDQLVYTNTIAGYPDIKDRSVSSLYSLISFAFLLLVVLFLFLRKKGK